MLRLELSDKYKGCLKFSRDCVKGVLMVFQRFFWTFIVYLKKGEKSA